MAGGLTRKGRVTRARIVVAAAELMFERAIRDGLAAMRERGELRPEAEPAELAPATLAALQGGLLRTQVRRNPAPIATALDAALDHIRSFAPDPSPTGAQER